MKGAWLKITEEAAKEFEEEEALRIKKPRCSAVTHYNIMESSRHRDRMLLDEFQPDAMSTVDILIEDNGDKERSTVSLQKCVSENILEEYPIAPSSPLPQRRQSVIKGSVGSRKASLMLSSISDLQEELISFIETQQHNTDQSSAANFPWRQSNLEDIFSQLAMDDQGLLKEDLTMQRNEAIGDARSHAAITPESSKRPRLTCLKKSQSKSSVNELDITIHSCPCSETVEKSSHGDQAGLRRPEDASFSHAEGHLIGYITGLHPWDEWDEIRALDLTGRNIESVIKLSHLVPSLEVLLLNENRISYLTGVPASVKTLQARNNLLSDLTSFRHLINLQYLNISNNGIEDLTGLFNLIHLRDLSVEGNKVRSLRVLQQMDGLIRLNLSRNCLTQLDFRWSRLQRLEFLDVSHNHIEKLCDLESLTGLTHANLKGEGIALDMVEFVNSRKLYLSGNPIHVLDFDMGFYRLEYLEICAGCLSELPFNFASLMPNLRGLNLSYNSLTSISALDGLHRLRRLVFVGNNLKSYSDVLSLIPRMRSLTTLDLRHNPLTSNMYPAMSLKQGAKYQDTYRDPRSSGPVVA
ncbi:hypothetical protein BGZ82_000252 [Podila clonocystis]|nr:hypothetical protein BGZ82_000252 [Podila clonocystis]